MKRIICIGNRYIPGDSIGPEVYRLLKGQPLPDGVEVMDGGLSGLDLLPFIEGAEKVVFVDRIQGFGQSGEVIVLEKEEAATAAGHRYDHAAGLGYLLRALPEVCEPPIPTILLVGLEGSPGEGDARRVADFALNLALHVRNEADPKQTLRR